MILDGPLAGQISVIDTALAMAADHGAEDAYARNAAVWARREAQHLLNAHLAVRDPWGGIKLPDGVE
jgi:putative IMPACT (imprinted ancient) family translation regulator